MKKGFTLIELLAVILILGIIALIAVPKVTDVINEAKERSLIISALNYKNALDDEIAKKYLNDELIEEGYKSISEFSTRINNFNLLSTSGVFIKNNKVIEALFHVNDKTIRINNNDVSLYDLDETITISGQQVYNPVNMIEKYAFGTSNGIHNSTYKSKVKNISFALHNNVPNSAVYSDDVSKDNNGSVIAWWIERTDGFYDLVIGSEGGVLLNTDSIYLFSGFSNVESIDMTNSSPLQATSLSNMFVNCPKLVSINFTNFNTKNITNMYRMFYKATSLTTADFSNFNTENVTTMAEMFYDTRFVNLDLSSFYTPKLKATNNMFNSCTNLKYLDISNLDTRSVTNMEKMFYKTSSLIEIKAGDNFIINEGTNITSMFAASKLSSIN